MTRMKYFELFTKYIKGEINVNGLILEPTSLYFKGEIIFQIKNPNDVSYSIPALNGYLIEILTNFNEFLGFDDNEMIMTEFIIKSDTNLYVNDRLYDKLDDIFSNIKVLTLGENYGIKLDVEHVRFSLTLTDDEYVKITNYVKPIKGYRKDIHLQDWTDDNLWKIVNKYEMYIENHKYDESELSYHMVDEVIDESSLVDNEWQVFYVATKFI